MTTHAQWVGLEAPSSLLEFGTDVALRSRWFVLASFQHPAKLHLGVLCWLLDRYTMPGETIADPMAGSGSVLFAATMQRQVIAREIEPRWLDLLRANATHITAHAGLFAGNIDIGQADAREPWGYQVDHIVFSPPYGNEASATPDGRRMLPYRLHQLTVPYDRRWQYIVDHPTPGAMGAVTFHYGTHPNQIGHFRGARYWQAMRLIYTQAYLSLRSQGSLILIVKDHIREGKRVATTAATITVCEELGFSLHAHHQRYLHNLSLWQRRRKERGEPVIEEEDVLIFRKQQANDQKEIPR
ncbi:MAG: TRM11 family SAM-dependent methyltransferase [Ktedonobacteraceae bacterium]